MKQSLSLFLLAVLVCSVAACDRKAPAAWREMGCPLANSEILPGADADNLKLVFRDTGRLREYLREYKRCLTEAGYSFRSEGKNHDPPTRVFSLIYEKGASRIKLDIRKDKDLHVQLMKYTD